MWAFLRRKRGAEQKVTSGRFEIEEDGQVAYLEYRLTPTVLELNHTEVPATLRGKGLAAALAQTGLQYARDHNLKVDIICPSVLDYVAEHPEYSDLVLR
jgi:predicted GNAT family acetyltransferase